MAGSRQDYGALVMIGFGSIGKGMLHLLERHFEFDRSRFVVIDPNDADRALLDANGIRFVRVTVTRDGCRFHRLRENQQYRPMGATQPFWQHQPG